jgi:hypothetical protein
MWIIALDFNTHIGGGKEKAVDATSLPAATGLCLHVWPGFPSFLTGNTASAIDIHITYLDLLQRSYLKHGPVQLTLPFVAFVNTSF